jgi:hypothetical protein
MFETVIFMKVCLFETVLCFEIVLVMFEIVML